MGKFGKIAPDTDAADLTDGHVETHIRSIIEKQSKPYERHLIEKEIQNLKLLTRISDPKPRVTQDCSEFFNCLYEIGYSRFISDNPEQNVILLVRHMHFTNLIA